MPELAATFATDPPLLNRFTALGDNLTPDEKTSLFKDATGSNAAFMQGFAAGQRFEQIKNAIENINPAGFDPPALTLPEARTHAAQYQKWSLEAQQTIGKHTSLTLGYYGNHGIHELVQDGSANAFGFGTLPSGPCASPPVPPCADPRFGQVTVWNTPGVSNYNGMMVSVLHRWSAVVVRFEPVIEMHLVQVRGDNLLSQFMILCRHERRTQPASRAIRDCTMRLGLVPEWG